MRYVVREGKVRGEGDYLGLGGWHQTLCWVGEQVDANRYRSLSDAKADADAIGSGRVVRLLSREEAKAKARAKGRAEGLREGLLEAAKHLRTEWVGHDDAAEELEEMAAEQGAGRGEP